MIVIDASALAALLLNQPNVGELRERLLDAGEWHAPHLIDLEIVQVLRRGLRRGSLTEATALEIIGDLNQVRLTRYAHTPFSGRIWQLRENMTAYDAAYVALAEALAAPLVTMDGPLSRTPGHRANIEFYGTSSDT